MRITFIIAILFSATWSFCQETIYLKNPSFEDVPRRGGQGFIQHIDGWFDCGRSQFKDESPPDIHPTSDGAWKVQKYAMDGDTYLGMVVRDNDSWEALSQKLSSPLLAGTCYSFSILLSRSQLYVSHSQRTKEEANYDRPTVLRIHGANTFCGRTRLLAKSDAVTNDEWRQFNFKFTPKDNYAFIVIEAFYQTPVLNPYNGHILIDGASDIVPIPCNKEVKHETLPVQQSLAVEEVEQQTKRSAREKPKKASFKSPKPNVGVAENETSVIKEKERVEEVKPVQTKIPEESSISGVTRNELVQGETYLIEKLYFVADSSKIQRSSYPELNKISYFLKDNADIVVEIQGHTNGVRGITNEYCDNLSTDRAKSVALYLAEKGIEADRLKYKGYGKRKPLKSNLTPEGRKRNQRVEIKILSMKS